MKNKIKGRILAAMMTVVMLVSSGTTGMAAEETEELKENSWRYDNGVQKEVEESNEGIEPAVSVYATARGIDVSEHNQEIDWETVKGSGVDFAILRCGYGSDYTFQDDKYWARNVAECERLGIPYGVYLYSYATTTEMAVSEAKHVLRLIEGRNLAYPVYFDMEDNKTLNSDHAAIASAFCDEIEKAGYTVGVYANLNWWTHYLTDPVFEKWDRWVAQYNTTCDYTGKYSIWQYSSKGKVDGIEGNVDVNYLVEDDEDPDGSAVPVSFKDVQWGSWYYGAVSYVAQNWLMTGLTSEEFGPEDTLARAQLVTILYRHAEEPEVSFEQRFPDVEDEEFYTNAVMWASSEEVQVATGYESNGYFGPSNQITREELVTMLFRYANYRGIDTSARADLSTFPDAGSVNVFASEAMQWAAAAGIIKGDNGYINPQGNAKRAECAIIIMRFMELIK